ncbi:MAG: hypothetical protein KA712_25445 [Myxococcales bacterium]|nr:hypothetical protein [Myxococcales bacterium]
MRGAEAATRALVVGLLVASCETVEVADGCRQDSECPSGQACWVATCAPRALPQSFSVVVVPDGKAGAARTELVAHAFGSGLTVVPLARPVALQGTVESLRTAPFAQAGAGELSVVVTLPSLVPGLAPVETLATATLPGPGGVASFSLKLPANRLNEPASFAVRPKGALEQVVPPVFQDIALIPDVPIKVSLPGAAEQRIIEGLVNDAFDQPASGYGIQVMSQGRPISTRGIVGEEGRFRLSVLAPEGAPGTLELFPPLGAARPRMSLPLSSTLSDLGTLRLPAHPAAEVVRVPVGWVDPVGAFVPVVGAFVRFRTVLAANLPSASAAYVQEVQTGHTGLAELPLIGGALEGVRPYDVEVRSPPDSAGASRCLRRFPVGALSSGQVVPTTANLVLPRRPGLAGTLQAQGTKAPVARAVVTALRTGPLPGSVDCSSVAERGVFSTSTDRAGLFNLRVEEGLYLLEVRPPGGQALPLWQVPGLAVTNQGLETTVLVPEGHVLDGSLVGPDGLPCPACRVELYEASADGTRLRAEAVSDPQGGFRVVVPAR